jgi:hypothetical protein
MNRQTPQANFAAHQPRVVIIGGSGVVIIEQPKEAAGRGLLLVSLKTSSGQRRDKSSHLALFYEA